MGIPLYFRHLVNNFDDVLTSNKNLKQCDNLYLDLNCGIHYCCRQIIKDGYNKNKKDIIEKKMIENIISYINTLVDYSNPQNMLFIAVDGPAPKSKMSQQRMRRFKTFYERKELKKIEEKNNIQKPECDVWDTNAITPGTEFMDKLGKYLLKIKDYLKNKDLKVYISDSNVPGEGEHKIFNYIKENDIKGSNVIYGLDADLIMLCLASRRDNMYLLRETVEFNNQIHTNGFKFLFMDIDRLKSHLLEEVCDRLGQYNLTDEEKQRVIDDYIFLSFLLGNDFITHTPSVDLHNGGFDLLLDLYGRFYMELKSNLVSLEKKKINHDFLKNIIRDLGLAEDSILEDYQKKRKRWRPPNKNYDSQYEKEVDLLNFLPRINTKLEKKVKQGEPGWRKRYYMEVFGYDNQYDIDRLCHNYLEGLFWTFHYYNFGCVSWNWSYRYHNSPSFQDIFNYMSRFISDINLMDIHDNNKIKPFEQLLIVLPPDSRNLLPYEYSKLMVDYESELIEYYPEKYNINTFNKRYFWECSPILPYISVKKIRAISKNLKISKEEKYRNTFRKLIEIK
jgi:5'-3' exoribonuclease 2